MIKRDNIYLSIAAALIVTPASFMLTLFWLTGDPTLRPLGITEEKLADAGRIASGGPIVTTVLMGKGASLPMTRAQFETSINRAFDLYGLESKFKYAAHSGSGIRITYTVGKSRIGVYSLRRAAEGIRPTAEASQMATRHAKSQAQAKAARLSWLERITAD